MKDKFNRFAQICAYWTGTPYAFIGAVLMIVVWAAAGPYFGWSDTHQLIINTSTTVITFLIVFLIQATQNRDSRAIHLKLDNLLTRITEADTNVAGIENATEDELKEIKKELQQ